MQMLVMLSLAGLLIPLWIKRVAGIENEVKFIANNINQELLSGVRRTAALFSPINASTINLARLIKLSLDKNDGRRLSKAESMVASTLFQALWTIPNLRQISYVGLDGSLFAYYTDQGDQPYALYSNSTFSSTQNDTKNYTWYIQSVNRDTGKLYGEAIKSAPSAVVNSSWFQEALKSTNGYASVGTGWANSQDLLLLSTAAIDGGKDGNVLTQGIPNTRMILDDNKASFQLLGHDGDQDSAVGSITCQSHDGESIDTTLSIWGRKYVINCSPVEIAGLQLVYVLALPHNGLSSLIHKNIRLAFVLLMLMIGGMVLTTCTFVYLIVGAARREMYLCGALINQMEATQQSERKSMNKSLAFATASHDVRASLAGITGILNSILDTSKIEAGKMQLEEEEFDIEQLLEDVVDLYHPVGMKKGVDVILDPYDGSITNVLMLKIERAYSGSEVVNTIQRDPNHVEFVFEVNDTGKGIPKEKQKSIFENYVQVKETALGLEGTGLGLGIVQSLVRLMGGEIAIVDKEIGERGTCFRFNVFFSAQETHASTHARAADIEAISSDSFQHLGPIIRIHSPKTEGSQVILFIQSDKRRYILQSFMQRLGIKVHVVKQHEQLSPTLKRIKQKLNLSHHISSGKSEGNSRSDGHTSHASSTRSKEVPLSTLDGMDNVLPTLKKPNVWGGTFAFILVVIDTSGGPFREISRAVAEFRMDLNEKYCSRVVWLDRPDMSSTNFQGLDEDKLPASDLVITKPFHGSRFYETIRLLPEFGGMPPRTGETIRNNSTLEANTSYVVSNRKPLMGKKILVADDDPIGRKIAVSVVSQLGANIVSCENGEEAWRLVYKNLTNDVTNAVGASKLSIPFDCILMDCQMPMMDGVEATRRIREVEKRYGVHTPIIALTAHDRGEEIKKMIEVGVDGYVTKPLNRDNFLRVISQLISKT
ncbi:UNVERIFIED_CONTAM: Histidine kinase CKI1 [Sesamum radiatum]|uniref:histidine kinase n=1 Tax=Sesamum radiatum TaxID=300843 RepID=A0AAW2W2W3_SESRA